MKGFVNILLVIIFCTGLLGCNESGGGSGGDENDPKKEQKEIPEPEQIWTFEGHTKRQDGNPLDMGATAVAAFQNGDVVSGGDDKTVRRTNTEGKQIWKEITGKEIYSLITDKNENIYVGRPNDVLKLDEYGIRKWKYTPPDGTVDDFAFDKNENLYCVASKSYHRLSMDPEKRWSIRLDHDWMLLAIEVDSMGHLYIADNGGILRKIAPPQKELWANKKKGGAIWDLSIYRGSKNREILVVGYRSNIRIFSLEGKVISKIEVDKGLNCMDVDKKGYIYAGVGSDIVKYDQNGKLMWRFTDHTNDVKDLSIQGDYLYSASRDRTVRKIRKDVRADASKSR